MDTQSKAQIFLADGRGLSQSNGFQSYHTFNFGTYKAEGREPFGALCLLNDDVLRAGASLRMRVETTTEVILIPVVGGLEYEVEGKNDFLEASQVGRLSLSAGMSYTVSNPYETETINVLQLWLTSPAADFTPGFRQNTFDLSAKNTLLSLFDICGYQGFIGQYDGRAEEIHPVRDLARGVFVFVLQGVFEVANRLLHAKDGLALRGIEAVEFEALSNDAILILVVT